jgi:hypothetical protein
MVGIDGPLGKPSVVEVTGLVFGPPRRLRRWLGGGAPPSFRGALFLALSTFLCGCVVAGFVFVGIWRNTATEKAQTQAAQQSAQRQLREAERTLAGLRTQLAHEQQLLARTRRRAAEATTALAETRKEGRGLTRSLTSRLHELISTAAALAGQTATMESELTALETYARHPGAAGVDAGYLATQTRYLVRSAAAAAAASATLTQLGRDAQRTLGA